MESIQAAKGQRQGDTHWTSSSQGHIESNNHYNSHLCQGTIQSDWSDWNKTRWNNNHPIIKATFVMEQTGFVHLILVFVMKDTEAAVGDTKVPHVDAEVVGGQVGLPIAID